MKNENSTNCSNFLLIVQQSPVGSFGGKNDVYNKQRLLPVGNPFKYHVVCVFFPFILDIKFVGRTQPGSHRRKVTQDFSSTFFLRCVP